MRPSELVAEYIKEHFENIECRTVNLDFYKGLELTSFDRYLAFKFGFSAIDAVKRKNQHCLSLKGFDVVETPYKKEILQNKEVDIEIYKIQNYFLRNNLVFDTAKFQFQRRKKLRRV